MSKARTSVHLPSQTWTGTLEIINVTQVNSPANKGGENLWFQGLGGGVVVQPGDTISGPPHEHDPDDDPPPGESPPGQWFGYYHVYTVTVSAPSPTPPASNTDSVDIYVWSGDMWGPGINEIPEGATVIYTDLEVGASIQTSGLFLKVWTEENPIYSDGGILAFVERQKHEVWYADENSSVTVSASTPAGTISVTGPLNGAGGEVEIGTNFALTFGFQVDEFDYSDTPYVRISDIKWGDHTVDTSHLELYNPGDDAPDDDYPNWGRTQTQTNCFRVGNNGNGVAMWSHNYQIGISVHKSWKGQVWAPLWVHFKPRTGKFSDQQSYDDIKVYGSPVEYDEATSSFKSIVFSGEKEVAHHYKSWEWEREWRKLSGNIQYLYWDRDDMKDKGEDVGEDGNPNLNNQTCALIIHPIDVSDFTGMPHEEWPSGLVVNHTAPLRVIKPEGVPRPANWVGSGGLSVDPSNNDKWTISQGSSSPQASISLATRKWNRLNRIVAQDPSVGSMMKHRDLVIVNKANVDKIGDDYIDPESERIPENIWHWQNFAYAELRMKAPRDATIQVRIDYSTISCYDPCYPTLDPGEFSWNRQQHQVTYTVSIGKTPAGTDYSSVVFDLANPSSGTKCPTLYHVDKITLIFPQASTDEEWIFDDIYITGAYWDDDWGDEPVSMFEVREYDPWDFLGDYTGFAAVVSGLRCLNVPYGYEEYERIERSLKQRQKARSRVEGSNIMDYAKPLRRLVAELNWQEGWSATYSNPEDSTANKDYEDNRLITTFRWWDLLRHHEWAFDNPARSSQQELSMAPIVSRWQIVAGIKHVIEYEKFAQGKAHGISFADTGRNRYATGIKLYGRPIGTEDWQLLQTCTTDGHGRYKAGPGLEKGWQYKIDDVTFNMANVRYYWALSSEYVLEWILDALRYPHRDIALMCSNGSSTKVALLTELDGSTHKLLDGSWKSSSLFAMPDDDERLIYSVGGRAYLGVIRDTGSASIAERIDETEVFTVPYTSVNCEVFGGMFFICFLDGTEVKAASSPDGSSWRGPYTVATDAATGQVPALAVDASGVVHVYYVDSSGNLKHSWSDDMEVWHASTLNL